MKTTDILVIAGALGLVGYLVYSNKDKLAPKPLTDADNEPLRASFDTGTNNGNGYQTEEEKPAADPVITSTPSIRALNEPSVKNAEFVSAGKDFITGETSKDTPSVIEIFNQAQAPSMPAISSDPTPTPEAVQDVMKKMQNIQTGVLPIPKFNTTTPSEPTPILQPAVAEVSPSAPVVSIAEIPEQPATLLYNNRDYSNPEPDSYKYQLVDAF